MSRYAQILLLCLTALIQLGAPLVHAHASGDSGDGHLHMPGLEFLEHLREEGLRAPDAEPESTLVVDMQSGVLESLRSARSSQACKIHLDTVFCQLEPEAHPFDFAPAPASGLFATLTYPSTPALPSQARAPPH